MNATRHQHANDRITSVTPPSPASAINYTWDDNGDLTARGSDSFSWDYEDRMVSATVNSVTTTFAYRGDGLRDSRSVSGGASTTFTWDIAGGLPVVLDDGNQYVYGAGLTAQKQSGSWYYYLADGLGSTMAVVNASGAVQDSYTYDVYGTQTKTGSLANEFDFAGQQTDGTGLQYLRARYYDPATGTFLSREPLAVGVGWHGNATAYAGGSPARFGDPSGLYLVELEPGGSNGCHNIQCGTVTEPPGSGPTIDWSGIGNAIGAAVGAAWDAVADPAWDAIRAATNASLTAFALGLLPVDKLASCKVRSDGIIGCFGVFKDFLDGQGAKAITIGNVILTKEYSWEKLGKDLTDHEIEHANQWAKWGLATAPYPLIGQAAMAGIYGLFQKFKGTCANPFEEDAGIGPGTGVRESSCPTG